jgi:hypothetical protein
MAACPTATAQRKEKGREGEGKSTLNAAGMQLGKHFDRDEK